MAAIINRRSNDPVEVAIVGRGVMLRIGGYGRGEGRFAVLTARDARLLAIALLQTADAADPPKESN